jgi:hypothetical protein
MSIYPKEPFDWIGLIAKVSFIIMIAFTVFMLSFFDILNPYQPFAKLPSDILSFIYLGFVLFNITLLAYHEFQKHK